MNMTSPQNSQAIRLRQQARHNLNAGDLVGAQTALEQSLQLLPNDVEASIELADVLFQQGRLQASTQPLLACLRYLPRNAPLIVDLIMHLVARGEIVAARACLDLLSQAPNPPAELLIAQAQFRFGIGDISIARNLVAKAIADGADTPGDWHLYALLLQFEGAMEEATTVLRRSLQRWPQFGDAAMMLVNLCKQKPETHLLTYLEEQYARMDDVGAADQKFVKAEFAYARFKTLDDLGRYDEAWHALDQCNTLMAELNPYDSATEESLIDALIKLPKTLPAETTGNSLDGPTPIFIVGMPRSGTTLLDRMLSSHSAVSSAGEIIDFWRQLHWVADVIPDQAQGLLSIIGKASDLDCHRLGERYLRQTQWRAQGKAFYVDKLPANIQMVAFIRRALPHAPILHMVREPMDTCFSNFKAMFGNVSSYSYQLDALAHYYRQYSRLVDAWHRELPGAMLDVPYVSLVSDPAGTLDKVLKHCGLPMEEACLTPEKNASPVATPSSAQVRESIHRRGVDQWRHYEVQLEPLKRLLQAADGR